MKYTDYWYANRDGDAECIRLPQADADADEWTEYADVCETFQTADDPTP